MAEPVRLVPQEGGAIGFLSRGEAEACYHARPAGVPLRPDGTPDWPSSACRVVFGYEPPGLTRSRRTHHHSIPEQLDLDEAI
jgi:hypothetical protein